MEAKHKLSHQLLVTIPSTMSFLSMAIKDSARGDLGVTQFRILSNIVNGTDRVKDIAEANGVSQPAISKMVELMVKMDLISRERDGGDRRSSVLRLTFKGKEIYNSIEQGAVDRVLTKLKQLEDSEVREIEQALEKLEKFVV
ncbi:MAG: hypothetical protein CME63_15840 [Halobacteriovoraceae bacterium]|nr:hypothetical protein [Halobacteriovoraceae bacterium]|tara:strand:+ start:147483 stop:147908 length:426 start_codon:yes stop_codon:yes gene_type:complete